MQTCMKPMDDFPLEEWMRCTEVGGICMAAALISLWLLSEGR